MTMYLPNATVKCPIVPFVDVINSRISKVRQSCVGRAVDGYAIMNN